MDLDISIIFVNYHTSDLILNSIKSIKKFVKDITYEIIIVDNNSEKNLDSKFNQILSENTELACIYLKENLGFGRANNEGAKISKGKNLFFLNPDTILLNNAVKILFDFIETHPNVGACGGNLIDANHTPAHSFRKIFPGITWDFNDLTHNIFSCPFNQRSRFYNFLDSPIPVAYISGADLMIKRNIFFECGEFPKDLFMYWDDVEICKHIKELGFEIYNVPQAKICHLESRSFDNNNISNNFKIELQEKFRHIYLKRNIGFVKKQIADLFYVMFLESRILGISNHKKKEYYKKRKELFYKYKS